MKHFLLTAATGALIVAGCGSPTSKSKEGPRTLSNTPLAGLLPPTATRVPTTKSRSNGDGSSFVLFETGQVRPIALSPNGRLLLAANTPGNLLEVFALGDGAVQRKRGATKLQRGSSAALTSVASVAVGLEPIAVAARSDTEVWVVNHLSDSVSIVDLSDLSHARVVRTLWVGDEPRDIVFAGPSGNRAFITTAHRGQNAKRCTAPFTCEPLDPQLSTPGIGRADVWVFDANYLGDATGGTPETVITLFCDTPRALAVSPDGNTVYAAAFHSGNRTTTLNVEAVVNGGGPLPSPDRNHEGFPRPLVGLIVKSADGQSDWLDETGYRWDNMVRLSLPDRDVFAIDAEANPPVEKSFFASVGTVLFNMAVNPVSGKVYVSNTDAQNHNRFEGPGVFAGHTVRGHLAESRIAVLDGGSVVSRHLNKHIDYAREPEPTPNETSRKSLATPTSMAVSSDGRTLYVAAFGSSKVGIFDTAALEEGTFTPDESRQIAVRGGGPSGVALDAAGERLYVLTRFDNSIYVINTATREEIGYVAMFNPEPPSVVYGRKFLYDASITSSNGEASCSSCHIFGDFDSLAWDLGNPDGDQFDNLNPFQTGSPQPFHPMKGPMTTQSLRGMDNHGPMHWRGDRTGAADGVPNVQPNGGAYDEEAAFKAFNVAFNGLLGRSGPLTDDEMQQFTDFVLQIMYPPNPIRQLDNSLTPDQRAGRNFYFESFPSDGSRTCNGCHVLNPDGNRNFDVPRPGFFGSDGQSSNEAETQLFKIPHLRNLYQKVGMFGQSPAPLALEQNPDPPFMGDQVRGFGFLHDGSVDTLFEFHGATVFIKRDVGNPGGIPRGEDGTLLRRQIESFILAFDTNLAPIVGQQVTLTASNVESAGTRIDLLKRRAAVGECDLVVKGQVKGQPAGFLYNGDSTFTRAGSEGIVPDLSLRALAGQPGGELTFTCVPAGSGRRIAGEL